MNVSTLNIAVEIDDKGSVKLKQLGKEAKNVGDQGEKSFKGFSGQVVDFVKNTDVSIASLVKLGGVSLAGLTAGIGAVTTAVVSMTDSAGKDAKEIQNLARISGLGIEQFQNYAYATSKAGIEQDKFADINKDVRDKLGDFIANEAGPFVDFFDNVAPAVGLTAKELQGLSGPDVLVKVKSAMDAANLSIEEQTFYLESLASDATLLAPLLEENGRLMKEEALHAADLGLALSQIEADKLVEAQETIADISGQIGALKTKVLAETAPVLVEFAENLMVGFTDGKGSVDDLTEAVSTHLLQGFDLALTGVEFFHINWLRLRSAVPVVVNTFVKGTGIIFNALTNTVLKPLDLIFEAAEKAADFLGQDFVNPLDSAKAKIASLGEVTQGVMEENFDSILTVQNGYDELHRSMQRSIDDARQNADENKTSAENVASAWELSGEKQRNVHSLTTASARKSLDEQVKAAVKAAGEMTDSWDLMHRDRYEIKSRALEAEIQLEKTALSTIDSDLQDYFSDIDTLYQEQHLKQLETIEQFTTAAGEELGEFFGATLKGEFTGLSDAWDGLWYSMLDTMGNVLGNMTATYMSSGISKLAGWALNQFHSGLWDLKDNEMPAILEHGEMVIPETYATKIRANLGGANEGNYEAIAQATGIAGPGEFGTAGYFSGQLDHSLRAATAGFMSNVGLAGLFGGGFDASRIAKATLASFMMDFTSNTITDAVESTFGAYGPKEAANTFGSSAYGRYGNFLGNAGFMIGLSGHPVSGLVSGIAGVFGGYIGDAIGDLFNDREFEGLRDAMEAGRIDPAAVQENMSRIEGLEEMSGTTSPQRGGNLNSFTSSMRNSWNAMIAGLKDLFGVDNLQDIGKGNEAAGTGAGRAGSGIGGGAAGPGLGGGIGSGGGGLGGGIGGSGGQGPGTEGMGQLGDDDSDLGGFFHGGVTFVEKEASYYLDRGERVLSPNQNEDLTEFLKADNNIVASIITLTKRVEDIGFAVAKNTQDTVKVLKRIEEERLVAA